MGLDVHAAAWAEWVPDFVRISNHMAGITRDPTAAEISAHRGLLGANTLRVENLELFIHHVSPGAGWREPEAASDTGGEDMETKASLRADLATLVTAARMQSASADRLHRIYRLLRPFTDGNGRSGRALWMWQVMRGSSDDSEMKRLARSEWPRPSRAHHRSYSTLL